MFLPRVIGFAGPISSGKTTCAEYLVQKYGFKMYSFADPLKEACRAIFSLSDEQLYGALKETPDTRWHDVTPRSMMQYVGTDLFRNMMCHLHPNFKQDIWVQAMERRCAEMDPDHTLVIGDVRFPNEVESIRKMGGIVIYLERESNVTSEHSSENSLCREDMDMVIKNDMNLSTLKKRLDEYLSIF